MFRNISKAKKVLWNNEHKNLKIYGYPVEVYVQDKNESHASSGIYSLEKDEWIKKPKRSGGPKKKDLENAGKKASEWMNKLDKLMSRYYPDKTDSEKERILNDLDDAFDDIKDDRRESFRRGESEMNSDNITFKMLRRNGYLDKIWDKKTEIYDDLNSINESQMESESKLFHQTTTDFDTIKSIIKNGLIPQDKNDEGSGIWFSASKPFYDVRTTTFSIPNTPDIRKRFDFSPFYDGDIRIARKRIPFECLMVENILFGTANNGKTLLMSRTFNEPASFIKKKIEKYGSVAKYIAENESFNDILIYTDLFDIFVEDNTSQIFAQYPHIKTDNLLK